MARPRERMERTQMDEFDRAHGGEANRTLSEGQLARLHTNQAGKPSKWVRQCGLIHGAGWVDAGVAGRGRRGWGRSLAGRSG